MQFFITYILIYFLILSLLIMNLYVSFREKENVKQSLFH